MIHLNKRLGVVLSVLLLAFSSGSSAAFDTKPTVAAEPSVITIVRKPGQQDGIAEMQVSGKVHKITAHALQAWPVRDGQGALILIAEKAGSGSSSYSLRYFDLDSGRRRVLGFVPFSSASIQESSAPDLPWAFAMTGKDPATGQSLTLVGDEQAVTGILPGVSAPAFSGNTITFTSSSGAQSIRTGVLLGTSLKGIYPLPGAADAQTYLQLFLNGTAVIWSGEQPQHHGRWHTDGTNVQLGMDNGNTSLPIASLIEAQGVPAGTRFSVRLLEPLSSRIAKEGTILRAVSITPVVIGDSLFIPQGSTFEGTVTKANGVGWGFKHETASLTIDWNRITIAGGTSIHVSARIFQVENAQEKVTDKGKIQGIRSTATPGHSVENGVLTFAGIDPMAYIFAASSGSAVLGFAEPEILYNSGTELILEMTSPLVTSQTYPFTALPSATTPSQQQQLEGFVKTLPYQTRVKTSNKASDLTNLIFIGNPDALRRAFAAAGWLPTDDLTSTSKFRTIKTLSGNQTYTQAPMWVLLLDERPPLFLLSKTTNTFASRHHIRVFPTDESWHGEVTTTASSTQDIGIALSRKQKSFIHVIDQHIDNERSKVVNDLRFTGCVDTVDMVPRPWLPATPYNSTGDRLLTDGKVAVLHINSCNEPKATPLIAALPPNRFERIIRDTSLSIRNDLYRGNLIYQGISGGIAVRNYLRTSNDLPEDYGAWRKTDTSGANYSVAGETKPLLRRKPPRVPLETSPEDVSAMKRAKELHKWDPPHYEFAIEGGNMFFRNVTSLSAEDILLQSSEPGRTEYELILTDLVNSGWSAGGTVTINSWRYFSSEFSYFRQQGKYEFDALTFSGSDTNDNEDENLAPQRVGLTTRQFEYNVLVHARPPSSRWRPYLAVGPTFQLIALADSPLKKPAGPFTLGLKNIGLIAAAFDFGNTPALDGGGVFQFGLQYGGGIKYRVTPHTIVRFDYRETWSKNPDLIKGSYVGYESPDVDETYTTDVLTLKPLSKFFQDRFTLGVAFAF